MNMAEANFTFRFLNSSTFLMRLFQLPSQETCQAKSGQPASVAVSDGEGAGGHAPKLFSSHSVILGEWLVMQQPFFWHQKAICSQIIENSRLFPFPTQQQIINH